VPEVVPLRIERGRGVRIIDQTRLPGDVVELELRTLDEILEAIRSLRIRGAPLLGIAAACAMAIAAETEGSDDAALARAAAAIRATRPTAVDLHRAAEAARAAAAAHPTPEARRQALWDFAEGMLAAQRARDEAMARHGAALLPAGASVLTHCNTGALATGGLGTALGVVREAFRQGKLARCYATETRPLLQGARLTMWELVHEGIPATLLTDGAAASLLASGRVQAVLVGADRIARNGDTANKVGTLALAAAAARFGVPLYVVAPSTTFDLSCPSGAAIPIEERGAEEVATFAGIRTAPAEAVVYNPAFDVTPAELIAGWVTELGIVRPPFAEVEARLRDAGERATIH